MDSDGYPDDNELDTISEWPADDPQGLMAYVRKLWRYENCGYWREVNAPTNTEYSISTGGWSGNEELVSAMEDNYVFWAMYWYSITRGGHYEFRIPRKK